MKTNKKGFTLIELLVVVLIIGLLASIALPQYKKSVEKSKASQALILLKSVIEAEETYYLINNAYAKKFDDLDVNISWTERKQFTHTYVDYYGTLSNKDWSLQLIGGNNKYFEIAIMRLSGKYQGGGFSYYLFHDGDSRFFTDQPQRLISCVEKKSLTNHPFSESAGSYCEGIFNAKRISDKQPSLYRLP